MNVISKAKGSLIYVDGSKVSNFQSFLVGSKIFTATGLDSLLKINFDLVFLPSLSNKIKNFEVKLRLFDYPIIDYGKLSSFASYNNSPISWVAGIFVLNFLSEKGLDDFFNGFTSFSDIGDLDYLIPKFGCFAYYFFIFDFHYLIYPNDFFKFIKSFVVNFYRFQLLPIVFLKRLLSKFMVILLKSYSKFCRLLLYL